jgi:riboflavin biosynthesis pyrimidine reductase
LVTAERIAPPGAELVRFDAHEGVISPRAIVEALFAMGFRRILIEGGARTIAGFIEAGCVDRLHVLVAPVIIGSGRPGLDLSPVEKLELALRPRTQAHLLGGGDVLFDCDFSTYRQCSN